MIVSIPRRQRNRYILEGRRLYISNFFGFFLYVSCPSLSLFSEWWLLTSPRYVEETLIFLQNVAFCWWEVYVLENAPNTWLVTAPGGSLSLVFRVGYSPVATNYKTDLLQFLIKKLPAIILAFWHDSLSWTGRIWDVIVYQGVNKQSIQHCINYYIKTLKIKVSQLHNAAGT